MFKRVNGEENSSTLCEIYNSAIRLFGEKDRGNATNEIFYPQLQNDVNYIYCDESGAAQAFFSYRQCADNVFEMTSLYVKRDCQRMGVGRRCCLFLEERLPRGCTLYVKALKNAPWSIDFYHKIGFEDTMPEKEAALAELGMTVHAWSCILKKKV